MTVLLESPDVDSVNTSAVGAEHFEHAVYPKTALKSSDPTTCGEGWSKSDDDSVNRYGMLTLLYFELGCTVQSSN